MTLLPRSSPIPRCGAASNPTRSTSRWPSSARARVRRGPDQAVDRARPSTATRPRRGAAAAAPPGPRPHRGARRPRRRSGGAASADLLRPRGRRRLHAREARRSGRTSRSPGCALASVPPRAAALEVEPLEFEGKAVTLYVSRLHPSGRPLRGVGERRDFGPLTATLSFHAARLGPEGRSPSAARAPRPPDRRLGRAAMDARASTSAASAAPRWTSRSTGRESMPGTVPLRIARIGRTSGPTMMYLSGGPGRGRRERDAGRRRRAGGPRAALPADRLRPARDRTLRPPALSAPGA